MRRHSRPAPRKRYTGAEQNSLTLTAEQRAERRKEQIQEIRETTKAQLATAEEVVCERAKRVGSLKRQINTAVAESLELIDNTRAYYDHALKQYSPPEEKSIDDIVASIEEEFRALFVHFEAEFEFKVAPLPVVETGGEDREYAWNRIQSDVEEMRSRIESNDGREAELLKEISRAKADIEEENIKFSAHKRELDDKIFTNQRKIDGLLEEIERRGGAPAERAAADEMAGRTERLREEVAALEEQLETLRQLSCRRK